MSFETGTTIMASWQPEMAEDTATSSYWLNWRVLVCTTWLLISMVFASFLISRYEGSRRRSSDDDDDRPGRECKEKGPGVLYEDEAWRPCLKGMHPVWLLGFRVGSFFVLLVLLTVNAIVDGGSIFYYYTQWTFTLVTIYFGLGSVLSIYGCYAHRNKVVGERADIELVDSRQHSLANGRGSNAAKDGLKLNQLHQDRRIAGFWGYAFQIIFQINAGAVLLTDCVFWFIIVPFLTTTTRNYGLNFFMVNMHSVNIVFLLGDTVLNSLRFPWFRIAYFFLWTTFYVIFQWILHACISIWWPYPFLDLSASLVPLWYATVGMMHFPCYGMFILVIQIKQCLLSRYFPESYEQMR
ncbi:hypothetical protein Droror1_Dr00004469 [Drosera rotundifolia]